MVVLVGLLILAFWIVVPLYLLGLALFNWWKKRRPGLIAWILNPILALAWLLTIILAVRGHQNEVAANAEATAQLQSLVSKINDSPSSSTPAPGPANPVSRDQAASALRATSWDAASDGTTWINASETDKQSVCAVLAKNSQNSHTAAFFYTNFNNSYDPNNQDSLKVAMVDTIAKLDGTSPDDSYPPLLGTSWLRKDVQHAGDSDVRMIYVPWQDGHSFIHEQKIQSDGTFTEAGMDGPWDGDAATFTATTTVSGNSFTIKITAPNPSTQSGTYQVSVDGQELDLTEGGRTPARYTKVATLMNGPLPF